MFNVPEGYVLISEEMLKMWGKLEDVKEMWQIPIADTHSYVKMGSTQYMPGTEGFTMVCFKSSEVPEGTEVYILKENNV